MTQLNTFNQKLGTPVPNWKTRQLPGKVVLQGKSCIVEPLDSNKHALELFESYKKAGNDSIWTYVPIGPFGGPEDYKEAVSRMSASGNTHFAILSKETGRAIGQFCLMRADPANGVVEVGHVIFSSDLQRTTMATEAHYLLMKHVFETLKYRRYEWKCDSLNTPSRNAAERLGFQFEGTFRQAVIMKGRNRHALAFHY